MSAGPSAPASGRAPRFARAPELGRWFYTAEWRHALRPPAPSGDEARPTLLLLGESPLAAQLGEALRARRPETAVVVAGRELERASQHFFVLRPEVEHDYDRLLATLADEGGLPREIVHLWNLAPEPEGAEPLARFAEAHARAYLSLVYLARALARRGAGEPVALHVVSCGMQEVAGEGLPSPLRALLLGPCRALPRELPWLRCRSVDVDGSDALPPERLASLVAELDPAAPDEVVALRGHARLVPSFARLPLAEPAPGTSRLRDRGAYLVTGGLGGLGFALAEHLARRGRARLVLVGRHGLPSRDGWRIWLEGHRESDPTSQRIRRVKALEAQGAEVVVAEADVSDAATMREVVALARSHFGALDGVFHAAGVGSPGRLAERAPEALSAALAPTVQGTLALEQALGDEPLDFLVLYSSLAAHAGASGEADAAAAAAFVDAWARHRAPQTARTTLALGWSFWQEVGATAALARELGHAGGGAEPRHPLLQRFAGEEGGEERHAARLSPADWLLAEHRVEGGPCLLPSSAWLELACAAVGAGAVERGVEIRDLVALRPFAVADGETRELRVRFRRESGALVVESATAEGFVEHARGTVVPSPDGMPDRFSLSGVRGRCGRRHLEGGGLPAPSPLRVGPRWACLRGVDLGSDEALAELALPAGARGDLETFALHPALVDAALGAARALLDDAGERGALQLPLSFGRVRVYGALPPRVFCRLRRRRREDAGGAERFAVFDAKLLDEGGRELASFDEIVWGPLGDLALPAPAEPAPGAEPPREAPAHASLRLAQLPDSIRPAEGLQALERVLAHATPPCVLVSPFELEPWVAALGEEGAAPSSAAAAPAAGVGAPTAAAGSAPGADDAPRSEAERAVAALWRGVLGVPSAGRHDRFFERGGSPELALRLLAALEERFGVRLGNASLVLLTLEQLAAELERQRPAGESGREAGGDGAPPRRPRRWLDAVLRRVS